MNDLISKTAVIEILSTMQGRCDTKAALVQNSKIWQLVKDMPTVDAVPVRHGRWIGAESQCGIGCPFCGTPVDDFCNSIDYIYLIYEPNYCPNCGVKMDVEREEK